MRGTDAWSCVELNSASRTWYQWWLAVSINTRTRVRLRGWPLAIMVIRCAPYPA